MDSLSAVLAMLDLRVAEPSRFESGRPWSLRFAGYRHLKVGAVLSGSCWLVPEGADPVRMGPGDCYLLASGRPYVATSDLALEPVDGVALYEAIRPATDLRLDGPVSWTDPDWFVQVCGGVVFDETTAALLLDHLPPVARIAEGEPRASVLRPVLELLGTETDDRAAGAALMREELTRILFVQVLRTLLATGDASGWLNALGDPSLGPVLERLHREPGRAWTVAELASVGAMSRSAFAQRFGEVVGMPPLAYLTRLRVAAAGRLLRTSDHTVGAIAGRLGYLSEGSFSTAFKRATGMAPSHYRRAAITGAATA